MSTMRSNGSIYTDTWLRLKQGKVIKRIHRIVQHKRKIVLQLSFFFFSSRRRHTRCSRDWSSDVCSSDLSPSTATTTPAVIRLQARKRKKVIMRAWKPQRPRARPGAGHPRLSCGAGPFQDVGGQDKPGHGGFVLMGANSRRTIAQRTGPDRVG